MPPTQILITGATGFIGNALSRRLLKMGHEITILTRNVEAAKRQLREASRFCSWNPKEDKLDPALLTGIEAVVHLSGEPIAAERWTETHKKKIYDSRILSTRTLISTLHQAPDPKPRVLISGSAIGYYGHRGEEILSEGASPGSGFLAHLVRDWESELFSRDLAVRRVALRSGVVLGRGGGAFSKMLPIFKAGVGGPLGDGKQWMSWIHLEDLIGLVMRCLEDQEFFGPINATSPDPVRNADFTKTFGRTVSRPALMRVPRLALRAAVGEMADALLESQRVVPRRALDLGFAFRFPELEGALRDLCTERRA